MPMPIPPGHLTEPYARFVTKEVLKAQAAHIFDDLRRTLGRHLESADTPEGRQEAKRALELLSDVECRFYTEFDWQTVFDEVLTR